jgi:DNA-binding NtrC family response regulator
MQYCKMELIPKIGRLVRRPGLKRSHSAASQDERWRGQARVYSKALVEANKNIMSKAGSLSHNREQLERNIIQRALANNGYSRARAASALGISRVTLYKKMKKYGLMRAPLRGGSA